MNGCMALWQMCEKVVDLPATAVRMGVPSVIISALQTFSNSSLVQANACHALAASLLAEPSAADDAQFAGAVSCVLDAFRVHGEDGEVLSGASIALYRLVMRQPVNAAEALQLGTFPLLVKTFEELKLREDIHQHCVNTVLVLVKRARCTEMLPKTEAEAAMRALLTAMRTNPAVAEVQSVACSLLCELSVDNPQLTVAAAGTGAIEALVRVLRGSTNFNVGVCQSACLALGNLACSDAPTSSRRAFAADAVFAVITVLTMHLHHAAVQDAAAYALCCICKNGPDACAQAVRCGAVKSLCDAMLLHTGVPRRLQHALKALAILLSNYSSTAVELIAAGSAGIGVLARLLLSSTPQQDKQILKLACWVLVRVVATSDPAAMSSADVVLPLLHVLNLCSDVNLEMARTACKTLLVAILSSSAHAAVASERCAAAIVDAAARAHPADKELQQCAADICAVLACEESEAAAAQEREVAQLAAAAASAREEAERGAAAAAASAREEAECNAAAAAASAREEAERRAAAMADALITEEEAERRAAAAAASAREEAECRAAAAAASAREEAECNAAAAAASAREEAERRAAAMADALIAEEEAARAARAAPQAAARKRPKKKRGGGGGKTAEAGAAAAAGDDAVRAPEPEPSSAARATTALSALALHDTSPSAAAVRRRRRAATKAARRLAQRAGALPGGSQPAASAGDAASEEDADEGADADAAADEAAQPAAPPRMPPPPLPPPPPPPPLMKECCVCLLDMPAVEQMALTPCGHRCMCEACWREQLLPREAAARLCPICDARVEWAVRMVGLFDA